MDKQKFWDAYVPKKVKTQMVTLLTVGCFSAAVTLFAALGGNSLSFAFFAALAVFTVGVQVAKSRVCAVGLAATQVLQALFLAFSYASDASSANELRRFSFHAEALLFATVAAVLLCGSVSSAFRFQKMKNDYECGVNADFFNGKINPIFNPYVKKGEEPVELLASEEKAPDSIRPLPQKAPDYTLGETPEYPQADSSEKFVYGYGSEQALNTSSTEEYKEAWEMDDIKF